ncbi:YetF domain-containing protein [Oceanobacillus salinisoli]|uniref:YetF domain-containing protein n=1 Tax=Oceanobacillus salinisoli TaxID=2678611 RepID=UPI0012E311CC|nr:DUF421 domain-containing protein [Oceanobacillus salinisoli]
MDSLELLLRVVISFLVLFILARIMGRKEITQMTFFNFVSAIAIGSIAAALATRQNLSIWNGVLALAGWAAITLIMDVIDIKSKHARKVTIGRPIIVIKEGQIMENSLRKARLDMDSLSSLLRRNHVFSVSDVELAVFETSGHLSVNMKPEKKTVTKGDLNIFTSTFNKYPSSTQVISDGKIISKNLSKLRLNQDWLDQQLKQAGIDSVSQVFYAEVQKDGTLYIDNKDDNVR